MRVYEEVEHCNGNQMPRLFKITREIGIDAGHRVTNHHSKCSGLHGHRYVIHATVEGTLAESGSTEGMAGGMDFGFLKDEMMNTIDADCDHSMILWCKDPLVLRFVHPDFGLYLVSWDQGYQVVPAEFSSVGKLYVIGTVPTAENLAGHWFSRLAPRVKERSKEAAALTCLRVWETPNCYADAFG